MDLHSIEDLDGFIDSVLRSESHRPVPVGFGRRIEDRVRIQSLALRERRHFRHCLVGAAGFALGMTLLLAFGLWAGDVPRNIANAIPGFFGFYDNIVARLSFSWPGVTGSTVMSICSAGILMVLVEVMPLRRARVS